VGAGTLARPLDAAVRDADSAPCAVERSDLFTRRVLQDEWPHEPILTAHARHWDR